jgi:hypothetical protein
MNDGDSLSRGNVIRFIRELRRCLDLKLILEIFSFEDNGKPSAHDVSFQLLPIYTKNI